MILSGGAFNTPQLLQLSGIGDADFLKKGIEPRMHLPGVGENFEDHLEVYIQHECKEQVSLQPSLDVKRMPWIGLQWIFARKGAAASNHFEGGAFVRSNDQVAYPNLMFHFLPIAVRYDGQKAPVAHGYQVHVGPMYSNSRGSLKIKSKDPFEKPSIVFNYLSTKEDEQEWVEAIRVARNILSQKRWIHLMVVKFLRDHLYKQMKKYWTGCVKMVKQHYTHHAVQKWGRQQINGSCRSTNNESPWHGEFARRGCFSNAKNYKWKHSRTGTYACRKAADIIRGKNH